jgi:hypothetical protein
LQDDGVLVKATATTQLTNDLYHYTTADIAVYNILDQRAIRLSPYELTNDPQESRQKLPALSTSAGEDYTSQAEPVWQDADWWLRRYVKVACFTQDYELPENALDTDAFRGWAHPSLWAHYGGRHCGVCLRFDRAKLVEQFRSELCARGQCFHGPVEYPTQRASVLPGEPLDVDQVYEFGTDAVVSRYIEKHYRTLFFTKHHDWANEQEYRLILNEPSTLPAYVKIDNCLTGVVLGDLFPPSMLEAVRRALSRIPGTELSQLRYHNGKMARFPSETISEKNGIRARRAGPLADRLQELRALELKQDQAKARGAELAAGVVNDLVRSISEVEAACAAWENVETAVYARPRAIPPRQRAKRAGVPGDIVEYESGSMCVVENLPKYSRTLVIALAIQLLQAGTVRLHGLIALETWLAGGNQISELWRTSEECSMDDTTAHTAALIKGMNAQLQTAKSKFDAVRLLQNDPSVNKLQAD